MAINAVIWTSAWKQQRLGDCLVVSNQLNGERYGKEDVLSVSREFGVVNQIEFQGRSFAGESLKKYKIFEHGDITYTKSPLRANPYGIIEENKSKEGIVSVLYAVYHPIKDVSCSSFIHTYFALDQRLNHYLYPLVNKGAKNTLNISDEHALDGFINAPSYKEQEKIGKFFDILDTLLTLRQREQYLTIDFFLDF